MGAQPREPMAVYERRESSSVMCTIEPAAESRAKQLSRSAVYALFHHLRLFGWMPPLVIGTARAPVKTLALLAAYICVHREKWWQRAVHKLFRFGASRESIAVTPYKDQYNPDQRYIGCIHPQ